MHMVQLESRYSDKLNIYVKEVVEGYKFSEEREKPSFQKAYASFIIDRSRTYTGCCINKVHTYMCCINTGHVYVGFGWYMLSSGTG
jgi:hypothetical protein